MSNNFDDVGDFHRRFDLPAVPRTMYEHQGHPTGAEANEELMKFRINFMQEELDEFKAGVDEQDISQMADALVDLAYVVFGTAHLLGLPWQELWEDVQRANMTKVRAAIDGSDSKRGSSYDVIKPQGWMGPHTNTILQRHGFNA